MGYYESKITKGGKEYLYNPVTKKIKLTSQVEESSKEVDSMEREMMEYLFYRKYFDSKEMRIMLIPSFTCNLSCPYCFEKDYEPRPQNKDYFSIIEKLINKNIKKYSSGIHLNFFGGEPLIWKQNIFSMLERVFDENENKISTSYVTNGTLIEKEDILKIKKYNCKYIQITLDGDKSSHDSTRGKRNGEGTFDQLIETIIELATMLDENTFINVRINLKDCNINSLEHDIKAIPEHIRKRVTIMPRVVFDTEHYSGNNKNSYANIEEYYQMFSTQGFNFLKISNREVPCEATGDINSFYVLPDLSIWKCAKDIRVEEACIGKIDENGNIKYDYINIAKWFKISNPYNDEKCSVCKKLPECGGGCILNRIQNQSRQCRENGILNMAEIYG